MLLCRFAKTEALLRQEAGVDTMALSSQRLHVSSSGIVENVLYSLADQNPTQYADSFQRLAAWVDHSLDLYRVCQTSLNQACKSLHLALKGQLVDSIHVSCTACNTTSLLTLVAGRAQSFQDKCRKS